MSTERVLSPVRAAIGVEIAGLLREGCVLTMGDIQEVASRHGLTWKVIGPQYFASAWHDSNYYSIGGLNVIEDRIGKQKLIRSAEIPIEETEFDRVVAEIIKARQVARQKGQQTHTQNLIGR